jgi:hypothetical protein
MIRKAALVAEMEDGTRHIYEITDPVHLQIRQRHTIDRNTGTIQTGTSTIEVSGTFLGGKIWQGPMPDEREIAQ